MKYNTSYSNDNNSINTFYGPDGNSVDVIRTPDGNLKIISGSHNLDANDDYIDDNDDNGGLGSYSATMLFLSFVIAVLVQAVFL